MAGDEASGPGDADHGLGPGSGDDDSENILEEALDLFVYAPLGMVAGFGSNLPAYVRRGRQEVTTAKLIGHMAVGQAAPRLSAVGEELFDAGRAAFGRLFANPKPPPPPAGAGRASPDAGPGSPDDEAQVAPMLVTGEHGRSGAVPAESELAIPLFDSLAASQVVPRLVALTPSELQAVAVYEQAHRQRRTILNRIRQLLA